MKRLSFKKARRPILFLFSAAVLASIALTSALAKAEDKPREPNQLNPETGQQIKIIADKMISDNKAKSVEFIDNVRATQEDTVITGDRLKIFLTKGLGKRNSSFSGEDSIERIVVNGNVDIRFDNKRAVSQQAEYIIDTRILILSGAGSKIISGKDSISGEKITIYRTDGRIDVESGDEKPVEAVFFTGEHGLK